VKTTLIVGNPKAQSRTLRVGTVVARAIASDAGWDDPHVIDLAELAPHLFDWESNAVKEELEQVASSDLVIVASPTFKGTYTGLLKAFFDHYQTNALSSTVAIPVMTGAAPVHSLAVEVHLRPLLVELGASVPTRGLYVTEGQFDVLDNVVDAWCETARPLVIRALSR